MNALFLVEAGAKYGLGHLKRMQVLASELKLRGWNVGFSITDETLVNKMASEYSDVSLWTKYGPEGKCTDLLVVDGYEYPVHLFSYWKNKAKFILAMDDMGDRPLPVDCVLNHNIYGKSVDYSSSASSDVLAGPDYSLVDSLFIQDDTLSARSDKQVLVSFGGTDNGCFAGPIVDELLLSSDELICHVVCSPLCTPNAHLYRLEKDNPARFKLHHGANMPLLMQQCTYFIGAAGYSLIEALVANMQVYVCSTAHNQDLNVKAYQELSHRALDHFCAKTLVTTLIKDVEEKRFLVIDKIDGQGVTRVADYIETKLKAE